MVDVPSQVNEAADLAEELHAKLFGTQSEGHEPEPEVINDPDEATPEPEPPSDLDDDDDVPADDDLEELRKFKNRYLTLKGKYDAEVPRLHQEFKEFKQSVFERLSQQASTSTDVDDAPDQTEDFMSQFQETYGDEFTDAIRKMIAEEARKLTQPVQEAVASVEDTQMQVAKRNFEDYLDTSLKEVAPNWRDMWSGKDAKFMAFLGQPDPSGLYTYGQLAETFNQQWDADKLVTIFKTYTNSVTKPTTQPKPNAPQRDAIIAPSRQNTHTAPPSQEARIWTKDLINEFERADRQGKFSADESSALWNDLLAAAGEGRIR